MAMDNVKINFAINIVMEGDDARTVALDLGKATDKVNVQRGERYDDGALTGQCDVFFHDILAITTLDEVDLNGVVLEDAFGVGLALTRLKALFIKNLTGGLLTVGGASEPLNIFDTPATEKLEIVDDGQWLMTWPGLGLECGTSNGMLEFVHAVGGAKNVELMVAGVR